MAGRNEVVKAENGGNRVAGTGQSNVVDMTDLLDTSDEEEEVVRIPAVEERGTPSQSVASLQSDSEDKRKTEKMAAQTDGEDEPQASLQEDDDNSNGEVEEDDHDDNSRKDYREIEASFEEDEAGEIVLGEYNHARSERNDDEEGSHLSDNEALARDSSQVVNPKQPESLEEATRRERKRKKKKKKKKKKKDKKRKGGSLYEVSTPTATELSLHSRLNVPIAAFAAESTDLSARNQAQEVLTGGTELSAHLSWRKIIPKRKKQRVRGLRDRQSLQLKISIKDTRQPVLILYDQLEAADATAESYGYNKRGSKRGFQHVLFAGNNPLFDHSGPSIESSYQDDGPQVHEWYPHDPHEYILNDHERELAWLFEESMHCFGVIQWDYIWEYSSPALKIELRVFGGDDDDDETKYNSLVRWKEPLVAGRMKVVQAFISHNLRRGFRRPHMRRVLAILRLQKPCDIHGQRVYPTPDFEAGNADGYSYNSQHAVAMRKTPSFDEDEDWEDEE